MVELADQLEQDLPYVRRYARALTGAQAAGDALAYKVLQAVQADRAILDSDQPIRVNLFRLLHLTWVKSRKSPPADEVDPAVEAILRALPDNLREAVLLATIEGLDTQQIGFILGITNTEAQSLLDQSATEMGRFGTGTVLIIEDESLIVEDLRTLVSAAGHKVVGVARTHIEATQVAKHSPPNIILADIELADGSSGVDAVKDILAAAGSIPIVFVTAFPERLLTGNRPEPAFLITKPYSGEDVTTAIAQAMFFSTTGTLEPSAS